jgi:hypothetical protein
MDHKDDRCFGAADAPALRKAVNEILARTPITDLHTHIYAPAFGSLLLYGIDELLIYHYIVAEALRACPMPYEQFWALTKTAQADFIWNEVFIKRSPVSEPCRGLLTTLERLGLDVASRDLAAYRERFSGVDASDHVDRVFSLANVKCAVMTNDPFDDVERAVWEKGYEGDPRFHAALRIDPLLVQWPFACDKLRAWGYDVEPSLNAKTLAEVRRFLSKWIKRMKALYMAVSLPPSFTFPEESPRGRLIAECVLPVARDHHIPFALMIGVKRSVNPALRLAGDGVGRGDVGAVEYLCSHYPDNKFMVTMLSRENQHELCVAARKFGNLFLFGCWWFLCDPIFIKEITRMRFELLGLTFTPQHSDARVLDQVIYKWLHARGIIGKLLGDKYADLLATGWTIKQSEIERDAARLMDGNFWDFLK